MDEHPFQFLASECFDVFMLYDYRNLELPVDLPCLFYPYKEVYLLAWSLGVWVSQSLKDSLPAHTVFSVAINGTLQPIHGHYGISPAIFDSTLKNLSPATRENFYRNMFTEDKDIERFFANPPIRNFAEQAEELKNLKQMIESETPTREAMGFDMTIIGNHDFIIPAKNQIRFWKKQSTCQIVRAGHFPFYLWQKWEDIFIHVSHE